MINLLPPPIKEHNNYAKLNAILIKYLWLLVTLIVILAGIFGGLEYYIAGQRSRLDKEIQDKQAQTKQYKNLEDQAKAANTRLKSFKAITDSQTRFSQLLSDLAAHTPKGVFINSITLTGSATQAVKITATADSYNSGVGFRDALVKSPRIKDAAIDSISSVANSSSFTVNLTLALAPGGYR